MSKPAMLSDDAYAALKAQQKGKEDSLSKIILRFVPRPIKTFADVERHLADMDGPLIPDLEAVRRARQRKRNVN
ncbi:MAG TPA: hypothetical protein VKM56_01325 [Verrucomicrobiae bacterium]|nr:hypothetical protein [Verrucomicrobiae bacterium]